MIYLFLVGLTSIQLTSYYFHLLGFFFYRSVNVNALAKLTPMALAKVASETGRALGSRWFGRSIDNELDDGDSQRQTSVS